MTFETNAGSKTAIEGEKQEESPRTPEIDERNEKRCVSPKSAEAGKSSKKVKFDSSLGFPPRFHERANSEEYNMSGTRKSIQGPQKETLQSITDFLVQNNVNIDLDYPLGELDKFQRKCQQSISKLNSLQAAQAVEPFDSKLFEEAHNAIFDEYWNTSLEIITKLETSFHQRVAWHELGYQTDFRRSSDRLTKSEQWIVAKGNVLNNKKRGFKKSTSRIQSELGKIGSMDL